MRYLVVLFLACTLALPAGASDQPATIPFTATNESISSLDNIALTMKMGSLDSTWLSFITSSGDSAMGGYLQAIAGLFGGSQGHYFSKGQIIQLGGETYMVAYGLKSKPVNPAIFKNPEPPTPEKPTADSVLSLALIHLKTAGNLTEIHPFDLNEETRPSQEVQPAQTPQMPSQPVSGALEEATIKSLETESLSNLKQLALGLMMYTQDWDEKLPPMKNIEAVKKAIYPYLQKDSFFINPLTKQPYLVNSALSKHRLAQIRYPAMTVVFYEETPGLDETRGVALLDGTAKRVSETSWAKLKRISKIR